MGALRVDDDVDLGRDPASAATATMISPPLWGRSLLVRSDGSAVDHLDLAVVRGAEASISRSHTPACCHRLKRL
jgi:hypothetical protein